MIDSISGQFLRINQRYCDMVGYSKEEMNHTSFMEVTHPEDLQADLNNMARLLAGEIRQFSMDKRYFHKDGRIIWVTLNVSPTWEPGDPVSTHIAVVQDITERKRTELNLQESEVTFRKLFEDSSDAILLIDGTGVFVECNQAALTLLKLTREQFLYSPPSRISPEFQPDGRRSAESAPEMIALAYKNGLHRFDWTCVNADGGEFIVEVSLMPITVKGQVMLHTTWRDVTQRKLTEKQLSQMNVCLARSNTELESFAYVAAHDLREPLRNVTSFSTLLERRLSGRLEDEEREFIQIIKDAALRMDALVGDLLALSQVGRVETEIETVSLVAVVDQALQSLQTRILETNAKVKIDTQLPDVTGNRNELYQVFLNLIANAIKYSRTGEPIIIHIRCAEVADHWHVQVQDNGIGIEPGCGYEDRVFKLFQRLHQRNEYGGGTGVGLAICRKAVERHGGRIWVESDGLDKGSIFHVTLPKT